MFDIVGKSNVGIFAGAFGDIASNGVRVIENRVFDTDVSSGIFVGGDNNVVRDNIITKLVRELPGLGVYQHGQFPGVSPRNERRCVLVPRVPTNGRGWRWASPCSASVPRLSDGCSYSVLLWHCARFCPPYSSKFQFTASLIRSATSLSYSL